MNTMIAYLPTVQAPATPSLLARLLSSLTQRAAAAPAKPVAARKPSRRMVAELKRLADIYRDTQPSYADDLLAAAGLLKA